MEFVKKEEWFRFSDVKGNSIERKTEIRFDPLTNETSRIVFDPGLVLTPPDYSEAVEKTGGKNCPFCSENLLNMTPLFANGIAESGRVHVGSATVFPNLFPYSKHNGVVIFSDQHYVKLAEFTVEMMKNAFIAARTYIEKVCEEDQDAKYVSINWNYLPNSGGSILHPHMHIIISETPTNQQALINEKANAYKQENDKDYFLALYETEKERDERWIGEVGNVAWMHAYAPKSHNDFIAVLPNVKSFNDFTDEVIEDYVTSLQKIFMTLNEQGFASFNSAISFYRDVEERVTHARLIPRLTIGQLGTSDINYFQALHNEPLSYKMPEDIAKLARKYF